MRVWLLFWLFVAASWTAAVIFLMISGSASCEERGTCAVDQLVIFGILLLMPVQVAVAVYLKQRRSD